MSLPAISIIIPTYREAENLPLLIPRIAAALKGRGHEWEAIVVDDNSTDGTPKILEKLRGEYPQLKYEIRRHERGLSSAVLAGIALARHEYLVVMDADLSHAPEAIPELVEPLVAGRADMVIGSRYVAGGATADWGFFRWVNSQVATLLARPFTGKVKDPMAGFFALRRNSLEHADPLNPVGYKIGLELMAKCRITRVAEIPILFNNRVHGESKLTAKEQVLYLEHLCRLYDYRYPVATVCVKWVLPAAAIMMCVVTMCISERWHKWPVGVLIVAVLVLMASSVSLARRRRVGVMKAPGTGVGEGAQHSEATTGH